MATPLKRHFALAVVAVLVYSGIGTATASARRSPPRHFVEACNPTSSDPAVRSFNRGDAWRYSRAYRFPFRGWTDRGLARVIWEQITQYPQRKAPYPAPNLPSCRVARFGTEDRGTIKAGRFFEMLEPVDGRYAYELKDTFDRRVAILTYHATPPVRYHPSKWGWFIDGKWAGHDATRAFELQGPACKLVPYTQMLPVAGGPPVRVSRWVRDPNYVMIAFNPALGSPGKGFAPRSTRTLRVRAFIDRRAIPPALLEGADQFDFGCGRTSKPQWQARRPLSWIYFRSGYGPGRSYIRGYYFGEGPSTLFALPGESRLYNKMPYSNYNPRPQWHGALYAMAATTGVAGGGMVRGIVRAGRDRLRLYDEMRYCDPNYTLRGVQLVRHKRHFKKSLYFAPATYSRRNAPSVRWVFGRIDPDPHGLPPDAARATHNKASRRLFAWLPIRCDR